MKNCVSRLLQKKILSSVFSSAFVCGLAIPLSADLCVVCADQAQMFVSVDGSYYSIDSVSKSAEFIRSDNKTRVDIPSSVAYKESEYTVVSIADRAFENSDIESVSIPSTVVSIGNRAFYGCPNIKKIIIPESVESIGDSAFSYCLSLDSLEISGKFDKHKFDRSGITMNKDKNRNYDMTFTVEGAEKTGFVNCIDSTDLTCVCNSGKFDDKETTVIEVRINKWENKS